MRRGAHARARKQDGEEEGGGETCAIRGGAQRRSVGAVCGRRRMRLTRRTLRVGSARLDSARLGSRFSRSRIRYDDIVIQYPPVVLGALRVSGLGLVSLLRRRK